MEAKNFRIGNLILIHDCLQEIVELPLPENCTDKNTNPIKLNEKWLDCFGFVEETSDNFTIRMSPIIFTIHRNLITKQFMCRLVKDYSFLVENVHELQNLFFAITKQELGLKDGISACS